jgi:glycosyltransferase involved in cell wall biosynthesis
MQKSILFVHQGYELYGSDRTLVQSVQAAVSQWPDAEITVLIPQDGPLRRALQTEVRDVRVVELAILRKSDLKTITPARLFRAILKVATARRMMMRYDVTYINTTVVLDYILAACLASRPRVVHVHEIPTGAARLFFIALLSLSRALLIFNSEATRRSFFTPFWQRTAVVRNGVAHRPLATRQVHDGLNLLLMGRWNGWKGQELLLQAVAGLPVEQRKQVRVRLVGSVFGQQSHFAARLEQLVDELHLQGAVEMPGFAADPGEHYAWADVVVVPSIKPEPFGLVAIEGMRAGRCVIAANHGGLAEIVVDGVTGSLVEPGSVGALRGAIERSLKEPERILREGLAGRERFLAEFVESRYKSDIADILADQLGRSTREETGEQVLSR